jgi:zinc/manganese transport system ATP-binding protein
MTQSPPPSVRLDDVTLAYRRHPAVHHLTGAFAPGSLTAVVGPNGAGKSTLVKGIVGALKPAEGQILLEGIDRRDIAYLPQISDLDRSFPVTVHDLVAMGRLRQSGAFRRIAGPELDLTREAIAAVGLTGLDRRPIGTLSGGQLQRALFARMLLQDARLLILDEPFSAIDRRTTADLLALVHRWHGENRTIIAVLHDLDVVQEHFPDTLLIAREPIAWGSTAETMRPENLLAARRMSEAWNDDAAACVRSAA